MDSQFQVCYVAGMIPTAICIDSSGDMSSLVPRWLGNESSSGDVSSLVPRWPGNESSSVSSLVPRWPGNESS